jgi:hypothetical protein
LQNSGGKQALPPPVSSMQQFDAQFACDEHVAAQTAGPPRPRLTQRAVPAV